MITIRDKKVIGSHGWLNGEQEPRDTGIRVQEMK